MATDQETLRAWCDAHDTASLRAIARAAAKLARMRGPLAPWAALALARLAQARSVPQVPKLLRAALATSTDLGPRIALALVPHARDAADAAALLARAETSTDASIVVEASLHHARIAQRAGQLEAARAIVARLHDARVTPRVRAGIDVVEGIQLLAEGKRTAAHERLMRAFRWAAGNGADFEASEIAGMLGNGFHDLGELAAATHWYDGAIRHARIAESDLTVGIFSLYAGWVLHERGRIAPARACYRRARRVLADPDVRRFRCHAEALLALAQRGPAVERRVTLAKQATELTSLGDHARANAIAILGVVLDAEEIAQAKAPALLVLRAAKALERAPTSDDERIAHRMARRALVRATPKRRADLVIATDGTWFRVGARAASLAKYPTQARLLVALVLASLEQRRVGSDELIAVGWPGERMRADAAMHRLHVALSTLRSRGLGPRLVRDAHGYAIVARSIAIDVRTIERD